MLIVKTALKNILAGGKRTWLNVAVLSFTLVVMVFYNGIMDGWINEARRDTHDWETGVGQLWHPQYDRYDIFSLQDAHGTISDEFMPLIADESMTPVIVSQGVIYPQQRMQNVILKGIDPQQTILKLPSQFLTHSQDEIPAIIGKRMAKAARLNAGDRVMMRWRDKNGAFDAKEILIVDVFDTKVPSVDAGQIWLNLSDLRQMTGMQNEATYMVMSEKCPIHTNTGQWLYKDLKFLMADLEAMKKGQQIESAIIFIILLSITLLAVFDTQVLSIFRRQKEIGTYIALGMTPKKVMGLFVLEGANYSLLAIISGAVWGTPILLWMSKKGIKMPGMIDDINVAIGETLYPVYQLSTVFTSIIIVVVLSAFISYIPARKIAKQNVVSALKGKIV